MQLCFKNGPLRPPHGLFFSRWYVLMSPLLLKLAIPLWIYTRGLWGHTTPNNPHYAVGFIWIFGGWKRCRHMIGASPINLFLVSKKCQRIHSEIHYSNNGFTLIYVREPIFHHNQPKMNFTLIWNLYRSQISLGVPQPKPKNFGSSAHCLISTSVCNSQFRNRQVQQRPYFIVDCQYRSAKVWPILWCSWEVGFANENEGDPRFVH